MKTDVLIFSKNRTLQLKSLLLSLRHFANIDEKRITILYVQDDPGVDFAPLKEEFACNFVEQGVFLEDVCRIVEDSAGPYIQFMVDDLIFRENTDYMAIEKLLDNQPDIEAFSFRLGKHIDCGKIPEFEEDDGFLCWETSAQWGRHWNYFWDLSSALYRKDLVQSYLKKCRPTKERFPNPLEDHFYTCMPTTKPISGPAKWVNMVRFALAKKARKMACFPKSRCFTQGVNLVADFDDGRTEHFSPSALHAQMLKGYVVDFKSLAEVEVPEPNIGNRFFKLCKMEEVGIE